MSSAKAMYDKLQTVKTSGSKTPISDFKSVDLLADKKYMVVGSCYDSCDWALSPLVNKF